VHEDEPATDRPAIVASGLRKTFGAIHAIDGIDLALAPGRIYGLLGPNGSGKTTLIRLLIGLARPTAGWSEVLGVRMPSRPMLGRIGYMPQGEAIYPDLSVLDNLRFFAALLGTTEGASIRTVLELVELSDRSATPAHELSGGMRRRLSLACALVHRPPVLALDEPSVGVDPALRVQFWSHFRRLAADGTTILVASHVMDEAARCDDLLFIRDGRILARGDGRALRAEAGTADLEAAFLRFAGLDETGRAILAPAEPGPPPAGRDGVR
jgi:ABC-2 type transport system ATP-binding protein